MTSWNPNHRRKMNLGGPVLFLLLLFWTVLAPGDVVADDPKFICDTLPSSSLAAFKMISAIGDYGDTVPCFTVVDFRTWEDKLQKIEMKLTWDPGDLELHSVDFSPWLENHPGSSTQIGTLDNEQGVVTFKVFGFDEFISWENVAKLWFEIECFSSSDPAEVVYDRNCQYTHFSSVGYEAIPYRIYDGSVRVNSVAHFTIPRRDSSTINETLAVGVNFISQVKASKGFASHWEYPRDSLDFLDVVKGPALGDWVTLSAEPSEASDPATIYIYTDDSVLACPEYNTIYYVRFKNTMHSNYDSAIVTRVIDSLMVCDGVNSDYNSVHSVPMRATVTTWYEATISFRRSQAYTNTNDASFPIMMSNNFCVQLKDDDTVTTIGIDNTDWDTDIIQYDGYGLINGWSWFPMPGGGNKRFANYPNSPQDIGIHTSAWNVLNILVDTKSVVDSQVAKIVKEDTKLKECENEITIFPDYGIEVAEAYFVVTERVGCPFIYVWNGIEYEEDNTILAASELGSGEPVTDYYLLSKNLVATGNEYRTQIREFENEVSYIDQVNLVAVDHSPEIKVAVTPQGKIFGFDKEFAPIACVDQNGKDHLSKIKSKDGVYFVSEEPGYLIVTYSQRNVWPDVLYDPPPIQPTAPDLPDPEPPQKKAGIVSILTVEVQDIYGEWHKVGNLPPRFYPERSFYVLEASDLQLDEEFQVRISWDQYYSADELKYYARSKEKPAKIWSQPISAVNSAGGEILEQLLQVDEEYATLTPGQTMDLSFLVAPPPEPGMVRDFVLQTTGYYVSLKKPSVAPTSFALLNNYPNPFNASTVILYTLPEAAQVKLEIFNVLGQRIRVLVNEHQSAGYKSIAWDGKDDKGADVASGVYFYRLETENYSDSKKMVLMR